MGKGNLKWEELESKISNAPKEEIELDESEEIFKEDEINEKFKKEKNKKRD